MKYPILKLVLALLLPASLVLGPTDLILCKGMIQKSCECCPEMERRGTSSFCYEKRPCCERLSLGSSALFLTKKDNSSFQDSLNFVNANITDISKDILTRPSNVTSTSRFFFNFHPPLFLIKSSFLI